MNLATVLGVTAILEVAAAFAGWMGGVTYAVCRPLQRSPAWRHVSATFAAVGMAALTYFSALVALGQGEVLSGSGDRAPAAAGLLVLAAVLALGAGVPWGLFQHSVDRPAPGDYASGHEESVWAVARRVSTRIFLPFGILGLAIFAPRARGNAAAVADGIVGAVLVLVLVLVLAAVAAIVYRHRGPILRLAGWSALGGVPVITLLMALSGASLGESFVFSAASAVVWAPAFALVVWTVDGLHEAGISRHGRFHGLGWTSGASADHVEEKRPARSPRPTRRRKRRR